MSTAQLELTDFAGPSPAKEGARRRDAGMTDVLKGYAVVEIMRSIRMVADSRPEFTSEDVLADLPAATLCSVGFRPCQVGACFYRAAKEGLIEMTGAMVRATRPEARRRKIAVWRRTP